MTWRIKDSLPQRRAVTTAVLSRAEFSRARDPRRVSPASIEPGGYRRLYLRGGLSMREAGDGRAVETWRGRDSRAEAVESAMRDRRGAPVFDRAMAELQEKFLALKVDERADPFSYVCNTIEHRWPDAIADARKLTRKRLRTDRRQVFRPAAFGGERAIYGCSKSIRRWSKARRADSSAKARSRAACESTAPSRDRVSSPRSLRSARRLSPQTVPV